MNYRDVLLRRHAEWEQSRAQGPEELTLRDLTNRDLLEKWRRKMWARNS